MPKDKKPGTNRFDFRTAKGDDLLDRAAAIASQMPGRWSLAQFIRAAILEKVEKEEEKLRKGDLSVHLTEDQHAAINQKAQDGGLPTSTWARNVLLKAAQKQRRTP